MRNYYGSETPHSQYTLHIHFSGVSRRAAVGRLAALLRSLFASARRFVGLGGGALRFAHRRRFSVAHAYGGAAGPLSSSLVWWLSLYGDSWISRMAQPVKGGASRRASGSLDRAEESKQQFVVAVFGRTLPEHRLATFLI